MQITTQTLSKASRNYKNAFRLLARSLALAQCKSHCSMQSQRRSHTHTCPSKKSSLCRWTARFDTFPPIEARAQTAPALYTRTHCDTTRNVEGVAWKGSQILLCKSVCERLSPTTGIYCSGAIDLVQLYGTYLFVRNK